MIILYVLLLNLLIMKKIILFISLFIVGNSFGQTLTLVNNSAFDIFTSGFSECGTNFQDYALASGSPATIFALTGYGNLSSFGFISGGVLYTSTNVIGDNPSFCPTGFSLSDVVSGGGNSVRFVWSVDLLGNVTVTAF
jgi:hypothetical protein